MSLVGVQRRFRELGRIRLGEKGVAKNGKSYPKKLSGFRLTSPSRDLLLIAADLYGGEVRKWDDAPGQGDQWELYIGDRVDILLPPGEPLTQSFELWSGGGCVRRCNGLATTDGEPCLCPVEIEARMAGAAALPATACKPTTRLSVLLPRIPDIGVWRMETHGYNAAVELPGTVDLLRALSEEGNLIPAFLRIEQRTSVRGGETRHFVVPVLELPTVTVAELQMGGSKAIAARAPTVALPAGGVPATSVTIVEMLDVMNGIEPMDLRKQTKDRFKAQFGDPALLCVEQIEAAWQFLEPFKARRQGPGADTPPSAPVVAGPEAPSSPTSGPAAQPEPPATKPAVRPAAGRSGPGPTVHKRATELGIEPADLDAIILNITGGDTESAKDLHPAQVLTVVREMEAIHAGHIDIAAIRQAVGEWRAKQAAS